MKNNWNGLNTYGKLLVTGSIVGALIVGCGGGGGGSATTPAATPTATAGSSASSSGSTGVYTNNGASYALTPAPATAGTAKLLTLPNTGSAVGVLSVASVSSTPIATSLTTINGTSVDPSHNVGMAFGYGSGKISIFGLPSHPTSPNKEISTYDTLTTAIFSYSGGATIIPGAVMNTANQTLVIATTDGFQVVDYSNPAALKKLRTIPSLGVSPTTGVEVMENFAFDAKLPVAGANYAMIITGGRYSGTTSTNPVMTLVDANTGTVYKPDTATAALFSTSLYIDAAAVDTTYHVAVLADESTGTTFVDLTKLTLNAAGTYTLPAAAVSRITTYSKYDNLAIESTKHLVMMGAGFGGTSMVVGLLKDPAVGLGFSKQALVTMPAGTDDTGASVFWSGSGDPHGAGAYITDPTHPTYTTPTALALWVNWAGDHIAIINLQHVLDGTLAAQVVGAPAYSPTATTPKDIAYFKIP